MNPELLEAADDDRKFFSNKGKDDRESWVMEKWCALTKRTFSCFTKSESPDFVSEDESVEIVEVLESGRRRQDEVKQTFEEIKCAAKENRPPDYKKLIHDGPELREIEANGKKWIVDEVNKKANKYGTKANGWILLIYLNVSFADRINLSLVRQEVSCLSPNPFKEIHLLYPSGGNYEILYP